MSSALTKKEAEWLSAQARRLKSLFDLLNDPKCFEIMKKIFEGVAELNNCELANKQVSYNEWTVLDCSDYTVGVSRDPFPFPLEPYVNWLVSMGVFGVGIDIFPFKSSIINCHVRLFRHPIPKVEIAQLQYFINEVSLHALGQKINNLFLMLSRSTEEAEKPSVLIYIRFDENLNLSNVTYTVLGKHSNGKLYNYGKPVKPKEIIKSITRNQETRTNIEEAINEVVTRLGTFYTTYLLY
jgi:hypothetical protein